MILRKTEDISFASAGFTLVELMITLVISGFIVAAIYSAYLSQKRTYNAQDQVAEMQQNLRAAVTTMVQELRMAGYDPALSANATIVAPTTVSGVRFQQDITNAAGTAADGDGTVNALPASRNEDITYGFAAADDADGDGVVDNAAGSASFRRNTGSGLQPIAENIQAVEFLYTLKASAAGTIPPPTTSPTAAQLSDIRTVTISILARAAKRDAKYINTQSYTPASGTVWDLNGAAAGTAANDNYRRRMLITTVQCRNMGI